MQNRLDLDLDLLNLGYGRNTNRFEELQLHMFLLRFLFPLHSCNFHRITVNHKKTQLTSM